jgi:hypothetical protein
MMSPEEHLLIVAFFMKQNQSIKILLDILRSRGIITGDDAKAFEFSQMQDVGSNAALFDQVKQSYQTIARPLGIRTGLENLEIPLEWFRPQ